MILATIREPRHVTWRVLYNEEYFEYYGFVVPYLDNDMGSLLTLMIGRFPLGLPEHYIVFFLYKIPIDAIRGHVHREISAAYVYFCCSSDGYASVDVGYGWTVHDLFRGSRI